MKFFTPILRFDSWMLKWHDRLVHETWRRETGRDAFALARVCFVIFWGFEVVTDQAILLKLLDVACIWIYWSWAGRFRDVSERIKADQPLPANPPVFELIVTIGLRLLYTVTLAPIYLVLAVPMILSRHYFEAADGLVGAIMWIGLYAATGMPGGGKRVKSEATDEAPVIDWGKLGWAP